MVGVFLTPRNREANRWLREHGQELSHAFREIHGAKNEGVPNHPHGLAVLVPPVTTESTFDPSKSGDDPVFVHVSAHEDIGHLEGTWQDTQSALAVLNYPSSQFTLELRRRPERRPQVPSTHD